MLCLDKNTIKSLREYSFLRKLKKKHYFIIMYSVQNYNFFRSIKTNYLGNP